MFPTLTIKEPTFAPAFFAGPASKTVLTTVRSSTFSTVSPSISLSMITQYSPGSHLYSSPRNSLSMLSFVSSSLVPLRARLDIEARKPGRPPRREFRFMLPNTPANIDEAAVLEDASVASVAPDSEKSRLLPSTSSFSISAVVMISWPKISPEHALKNPSVLSPPFEVQGGKKSGMLTRASSSIPYSLLPKEVFIASVASTISVSTSCSTGGSILSIDSYAVSICLRINLTLSHAKVVFQVSLFPSSPSCFSSETSVSVAVISPSFKNSISSNCCIRESFSPFASFSNSLLDVKDSFWLFESLLAAISDSNNFLTDSSGTGWIFLGSGRTDGARCICCCLICCCRSCWGLCGGGSGFFAAMLCALARAISATSAGDLLLAFAACAKAAIFMAARVASSLRFTMLFRIAGGGGGGGGCCCRWRCWGCREGSDPAAESPPVCCVEGSLILGIR
mmetsp:Transcript_5280/g.12577  ORF Transcript_5280/g.12577 Transcript_5280/m.12577 type:complete len:451 (-) Transcript_5280:269-1621(-)